MNLDVRISFPDQSVPLDHTTLSSTLTAAAVASGGNVSHYPSHVGISSGNCGSNGTDEYEEFYKTAQYVTGLIIYPILCITGVLGNSLSLIVLSHKDMATSTNIYLLALGISDSLKLLNDFLYCIMLIISMSNQGAAESMMANVYPYAHYVFQVAVSVTAWLTVAVAVDRYISVCYPSRSKTLCTIPKARTVVTSIFVIISLLSIPSVFRYRLETIVDVHNNITCQDVMVTELGRNKQFMIPYTWVQNLLRGIVPVFILVFINAKIINVLRRERVKGKKLSSRNRITLMLIAMVLIFILCLTPDAIMSTFFGKGYVEEDYMTKGIREITDCLVLLNSAVNFILYCSLSAIFRNTFMRVFFGRRYVKMRGGSCRQISRDGTSIIKPKNNASFRQNNKGGGERRKSSIRELDLEAGEISDEEYSPKTLSTANGCKQTKLNFWNKDKPQRDNSYEMSDKSADVRMLSGVYMGPMEPDPRFMPSFLKPKETNKMIGSAVVENEIGNHKTFNHGKDMEDASDTKVLFLCQENSSDGVPL
ncbi:nociceptin receptor [Biomphalaria glabrata]|nr:nociceptin receptor [Biomphalaria glabrata]